MNTYEPRHLQAPEEGTLTQTEQAHLWYDDLANVPKDSAAYQYYENNVITVGGYEVDGDIENAQDLKKTMGLLAMLGAEQRWWHNNPYHRRRFKQAEEVGRAMVRQTVLQAETEGELIQHTTIDAMTGLLSRNGLQQRLLQRHGLNFRRPNSVRMSDMHRQGEQAPDEITVANIDGARVKRVNDTLGHHMGDEFIKVLADELRDMLRDADAPLIVHYSGDEYGVVFSNISDEDREGFEQRMFDTQVDKVASMRYVAAWEKIKQRRQEVLDAGASLRIEAADEVLPPGADQHGIRPRRMVVINGEEVVAIRDIAVMAVGIAKGPARCWNDYENLNKQAEIHMTQTKEVLHRYMPHDAALDTRPETLKS